MIVTCEECGLKYKIDPAKIKGEQARLKCKGCSTVITLSKQSLIEEEALAKNNEAVLASPTAEDASRDEQSTDGGAGEGSGATGPDAAEFHKRSGLGLTSKVILLMLLVSLLPGGVYFALSFKQTKDRIVTETTGNGLKISGILAGEVDEWIDKNTRVLKTIANLPAMQSMDRYEQEVLLEAVQEQYPWIYLAFTTDNDGLNIARSDGKGLKDYSNRQYVTDITQGDKMLSWQTLIGKTSKKPALVLSVPIKRDGETVGVLASAMTRDAISKLVTNYRQGETGNVFLVNEIGKVVAHQNIEFVAEQQDMNDHPLVKAAKSLTNEMVEFKGEGNRDVIGFAQVTKLGWTLAVQQDKSEAFAALKKAENFAYTLLVVTVVCIVLIAFFASRAIVTPIRKLTDAANRISVGDLGVEIKNASTDEIGDLAEAITRMQDSIRLSISRLKRRRK